MNVDDLRFSGQLLQKPPPRDLAVETTLQHFAILTYWVDSSSLRKHLPRGSNRNRSPTVTGRDRLSPS